MIPIRPNLWIAYNWYEVQDLLGKPHDYHVITVAEESPVKGKEFFPLKKGKGNDIKEFWKACHSVMDSAFNLGRKTLVHSVEGDNRSPAVVVGALMILEHNDLEASYKELVNKYPKVRIHPYLSKLLLELQEQEEYDRSH